MEEKKSSSGRKKRGTVSLEGEKSIPRLLKFTLSQKFQTVLGSRVSVHVVWAILTIALDVIFDLVKKYGRVQLPRGLGSFSLRKYKETRKVFRGEVMLIPAHTRIKFNPGRALRRL